MPTLILSCNTGAGHNSCALALEETYALHGDSCRTADALQFISERASQFISSWHNRIYLHLPRLFGAGYQSVESHDDIFHEGGLLYKYITSGAERLYAYILGGGYDNVICTHVFSALALTEVCRQHPELSVTTSHISTDYTCSPSTADSGLDWFFVPDASLTEEFAACGIPREKLAPCGIPVRRAFYEPADRAQARRVCGLDPERRQLLMMCGSMGCGPMEEMTACLSAGLSAGQELTIVCGTNSELRTKLQRLCAGRENIHILGKVDGVAGLMHSADLFLTKPGGLSTSEAAAAGLPMVLVDAVAGCEEHNLDFFVSRGMAKTAKTPEALAETALSLLGDEAALREMRSAMAPMSERMPAEDIYLWLRSHSGKALCMSC